MAAVLAIPTSSSEISARRYVGVVAVGSLHVAVIYVLLTALNIIPSPIPTPAIQWLPPQHTPQTKPADPPIPTPTKFIHPVAPIPQQPTFDTAEPKQSLLPPQNPTGEQGTPDHVVPPAGPTSPAQGIASTHTIPRYPMFAVRLAHEGSVRLKLTIDEQGSVVAAELQSSSGHSELDDAAIAWVKAHWRYTPAMQSGKAVPSNTSVVVTFRLDQVR